MHLKTIAILLTVCIANIATPLYAQDAEAPKDAVMIETDLVPFALDGFSLHARLAPAATPGWVFGVGFYGMKYPSMLEDFPGLTRDSCTRWSCFLEKHALCGSRILQ